MKTAIEQALRIVLIAGAVAAAIYALVLARASYLFHQDTAVSVAAAVRLQPHNAEYLDRLASWQPDDRRALLHRSVEEDPFNYNAWIRLGFLAEMQDGDNAAAETAYLKAAEVNHMFLPKWTLANFYFREQKRDAFFHWTKETLSVTPYASDPVFAQMWQMTQNEDELNAAIPDRARVLLQYAWYLANNKIYDRVPHAVERLVQVVGKDDPRKWGRDDLLAASMDHMLEAGDAVSARAVWSSFKNAGWISQSVPDEQNPITNGDFATPFYRHGFDWVMNENAGTRVTQYADTPEVHISFYGDESEAFTLMQQYVALAPGASYEMKWVTQGGELTEPTGLAWHLHSVRGGAPELVSGDLMDERKSWDFVAPAVGKVYLLTLEYKRPLGATRGHGSLSLKSVGMTKR